MSKKLIYGRFETIEEYFVYLEFADKCIDSLCYSLFTLNKDTRYFRTGSNIRAQDIHGTEDIDLYTNGGVACLDVWGSNTEYFEYKQDVRNVRKAINNQILPV